MAYNPSTTIVSAPVSFTDVQNALGVSYTDLAALCTASTINKWAKYKPVVYPSVSSSNDGKGTVVNTTSLKQMYGLTIPHTTDPFTTYKNGGGAWTYTKPSGGAESPYRLADFNGYRHNATPPIYTDFKKGVFQDFNIFSTAFLIDTHSGNSLSITDFAPSSAQSDRVKLGADLYGCPSSTKNDISTWQHLTSVMSVDAGSRMTVTIADLANQHVYIADGSYYAFVLHLGDVTGMYTMPWDDDHYFAAMYAAKALPFFSIVSPYIWMLPDINVSSRYFAFTPSAASTYTPGSLSTTFYLRIPISTYRSYNGLQRNLVFGTTDRIRIRINGRGDVYDGTLVNSSGTEISSQTIIIRDDTQAVTGTLYFKFTGVPTSLWNYGTGTAQTNYLYMYVSHDSGTTWQGLTNPAYTGIAFFK